MPKTAEPWSLTSLREKLIKIGAKVVSHGRYVTFQMAEAECETPPRMARVRPNGGTDDEAIEIYGRADHRDSEGA